MTNVNTFSLLGLIFDLIGVVILFKYGLPSDAYNRPISRDEKEKSKRESEVHGRQLPLTWEAAADEKSIAHRDRVFMMAKIGLVFIFIGFVLQLLGLFGFGTGAKMSSCEKYDQHNDNKIQN